MELEKLIESVTKEVMEQIKTESAEFLILSDTPQPELENVLRKRCVYFDKEKKEQDAKNIISPSMCINGLCNLAHGNAEGPFQKAFLDALLKGKSVIQIKEGIAFRNYAKTMPKPLLSKYLAYERELENMGVRILSLSQLSSQGTECKKRLLTVKDLEGASGEIVVEESCIVTALAKDYMDEHGILLKRI